MCTVRVLIIITLLVVPAVAVSPATNDNQTHQNSRTKKYRSKTVDFDISHKISCPGQTSELTIFVSFPRTMADRQKISHIKFSHPPKKTWVSQHHRGAKFVFKSPPKEFELHITGQAELYRYDLKTALKRGKKKIIPDFKIAEYLQDEEKIEVTAPAIRKAAADITGKNQIRIVKRIHNFVAGHLEYIYSKKSKGALRALETGKGDCSEFTDLFVALARAKKIPARCVTGYAISWRDTPKHTWPEVFLKDYGWVPFDPTHNQHAGSDPAKLRTIYLYVSTSGQDSALNGGKYYYYQYRGAKPRIEHSFSVSVKD